MSPQRVLLIGIAFVAAALGYMVGGSGSPVASVAIPAVFGLVATALGVLQAANPTKELLEYLKAEGANADCLPEIVDYRERTRQAPARIGIALIVFSACYVGAATVGAKVRIDNSLATKRTAQPFPWSDSGTKPPTIAAALEWMALQARLSELGYDSRKIAELYTLQVAEWKHLAAQAAVAAPREAKTEPSQGDATGKASAAEVNRPGYRGGPLV